MGIMRKIIDWCDDSLEQATTEDKPGKAIASGFVEGFCDAAIVMYIPVVIACYIYQAKLKDK